MIVKDKTDARIEELKAKAGITGDVYLIDGHLMESLESHNKTFGRHARSIESAERQRIEMLEEEARQNAAFAEEELPEA